MLSFGREPTAEEASACGIDIVCVDACSAKGQRKHAGFDGWMGQTLDVHM